MCVGRLEKNKANFFTYFYKKIINFNLEILFKFINYGKLIPPPLFARRFICGSFNKIGEEFLQYFIVLGKIKPNEKVLEVGCGIGQKTIPLIKYLKSGKYDGFDIVPFAIKWCQENITPRYPNFHFQLANVYNNSYNPKGKLKASEYSFQYKDESFDFVYLTSVFTHMLPDDIDHYFTEISRVLKKEGTCFITFFLLNKESKRLVHEKLSSLDFKYEYEGYRIVNKEAPEVAIAYNEELIRDLYKKHYLEIIEPIHYGNWCGRKKYLSYQDIIIAKKQ